MVAWSDKEAIDPRRFGAREVEVKSTYGNPDYSIRSGSCLYIMSLVRVL